MILSYIQIFLMTVCFNKRDFYLGMSIVLSLYIVYLQIQSFCHQA